jgi:hypothetical protein
MCVLVCIQRIPLLRSNASFTRVFVPADETLGDNFVNFSSAAPGAFRFGRSTFTVSIHGHV